MKELIGVAGERHIRPMEERALAKKEAAENEVANWEDIADAIPDFPKLAERHRELTDMEATAKKEKKELGPQLEAAVVIGGKKYLQAGSLKVQRVYNSGRRVVVPEKLVEVLAGLEYTAEQITEIMEKCTEVQGAGYYPLVVRVKDGDPSHELS